MDKRKFYTISAIIIISLAAIILLITTNKAIMLASTFVGIGYGLFTLYKLDKIKDPKYPDDKK